MTVVVKLGSTLVVDSHGRVRRALLTARAAEVGELVRGGEPVCVVSSGAIALGLPRLGLTRRPSATSRLQAASAVNAFSQPGRPHKSPVRSRSLHWTTLS